MIPGERIPLIKASIDALLGRFDDDAILVMEQFGLGTGGSFHDSERGRRKYVTEIVGQASDETLTSLHDFLIGEEHAPISVSEDDNPWGPEPMRVFLSHKWEDAEWVGGVRDKLAKYGITSFVAHKDITPSKHWREVIKAGLRSCHMMVAVLHEDFTQVNGVTKRWAGRLVAGSR